MIVWTNGVGPEEFTEAERSEALTHLRCKLIELWCATDYKSPENKAKRAAIVDKIRKWSRK